MEEQLELNFDDKFQKYESIAKKMLKAAECNLYQNVQLFSFYGGQKYYLGTRTFYHETNYTYDHLIDEETAIYLREKLRIDDFMGWYGVLMKKKQNMVTCKICGCTKTVEELKQTHSKCFDKGE